MDKAAPTEVVDLILNAAEELFAQLGYERASLRMITQKAGVNLAAVHYHLGDKEFLFGLVLTRRLRPMNASRLAQLEQAEKAALPLSMNRIIEIMVRPVFELCASPDLRGRHFIRLLGRSLTDPLPFMEDLHAKELQPTLVRFGQSIRRLVPNLTPEEYLWRLSFVMGALHHTLATMHRMKNLTHGICRDHDHEGALPRFILFAVATFAAPVSSPLSVSETTTPQLIDPYVVSRST